MSENNNDNSSELKDKKKIIALTACTTGVAHTYIAADKIFKTAIELGYEIKVETHGSKGPENIATASEIKNADLIIVASDIGLDLNRFNGKKIYKTKVSDAIKSPEKLIKDAFLNGKVSVDQNNIDFIANKNDKTNVMKHITAGLSYMIPFVILGGIFIALPIGLSKAIYGYDKGPEVNVFLNAMSNIGTAAFTLMIPILAGFIANSIAGRAAIAPAMVGAFIGNNPANFFPISGLLVTTPMGFLGSIIAGLLVGYTVRWINTWKVPRSIQPAVTLFFIPIIVGGIISLIFIFVIGAPIGWIMEQVKHGIGSVYGGHFVMKDGVEIYIPAQGQTSVAIGVGFAIGLVLGMMCGFDMGGPINKIAFLTSSALVTAAKQPDGSFIPELTAPMGAFACAASVAPLGCGISVFLFKKKFKKDEEQLAIAAIIMGAIGIAEGAIPFAIRDPKRVILCNVIGSGIAGAIGGALTVLDYAAHGGPIVAILGAIPWGIQSLYFLIALVIGVTVHITMYGLMLYYWNTNKEELEINLALKLKKLNHKLNCHKISQTQFEELKLKLDTEANLKLNKFIIKEQQKENKIKKHLV